MEFAICPRCNFRSFEQLGSHGYCVDCNYSPGLDSDYEVQVPEWALDAIRNAHEEATNLFGEAVA